jgi:hypothetical protein
MSEKSQYLGGNNDHIELDKIFQVAKQHGVARLKLDGILEVEFFKSALPMPDATSKLTPEERDELRKKQEELDLYWSAQ